MNIDRRFVCLFIAYAFYVFDRKVFSFLIADIGRELQLTKSTIGKLFDNHSFKVDWSETSYTT